MTPDLFSPAVILDTSVLRGAGTSDAPFLVLKQLVADGLVRVFVPQLAAEEFRTQWRDRNQSYVSESLKSLKAITGETPLPGDIIQGASDFAAKLTGLDLESISGNYLKSYLVDSGFKVLPLTFKQAETAWRSYFIGNLPSKKIKHRPDIPDAHILASLAELASGEAQVLFVSSDKTQRNHAVSTANVTGFDSLEELIKSEQIQPLFQKWELEKKWKSIQSTLHFDNILSYVKEFVAVNGGDLLSWKEVTDSQIPEDNSTALISMYGEIDELEIGEPEDWGGGILRYKATYFSECLLSFQVFRADAFDVPEWVSVTIGDFENDHYFEAEGYAVVKVDVDITVKIDFDADIADISELVKDIAFESGSLELSLTEGS